MYISLSRPTSICIIELDGEVKPRPRRYAFLKSRLSKNLTTTFHIIAASAVIVTT